MAKQTWSVSEITDIIIEGLGGQSTTFEPTYEAVSTLLDKIGLTISLQSGITDRLAFMDDVRLSNGTTVEEYVHDILTVKDYDRNSQPYGQDEIDTKRAYHYRNSDKKIELPVWESEMERAFTSVEALAGFVARQLARIQDTYNAYKFVAKKKALGEKIMRDSSIDGVSASYIISANTYPNFDVPKPIGDKQLLTIDSLGTNASIKDKATAEEFILAIQLLVEDMSFMKRQYNPFGIAQQSQKENMVLLLKKGSLPIMNVRSLSGVFNKELLGLGIEVVTVDDFGIPDTIPNPAFGEDDEPETLPVSVAFKNVYSVLCDKRIVRYMVTREKTTVDINGNALRTLYTKHFGENVVTSDLINYVAFTDSPEN